MAYSLALRYRAEDLYVAQGMTYEQLSEFLNVDIRTLKSWGEGDPEKKDPRSWFDKRKVYAEEHGELLLNEVSAASKLMQQAADTGDPSIAKAAAALSKRLLDRSETQAAELREFFKNRVNIRELQSPAEAVDAVWEALQYKISVLFSDPSEISSGAINEINKCLELWGKMEAQYKAETKKAARGISIKQKEILGSKYLGMEPQEDTEHVEQSASS